MTARIGIVGAAGRMGQMLVREVAATRGAYAAKGSSRIISSPSADSVPSACK